MSSLREVYQDYIDCLNRQDWATLGKFVQENVQRNGEVIGLTGYRRMLEGNYVDIPDLKFNPVIVIAESPYIASRLLFDCAPKAEFLGLEINGKRVSFTENVFYRFRDAKIDAVWSVIDKGAIESQL